MSRININLNVLAYADDQKSVNPRVKFADLSWSFMGLPLERQPKQVPIYLAPGETRTVMSTERSISYSGATAFNIVSVPGTTDARLVGTFGARSPRADGNSTTQWAITRVGKLVTATFTGTGTAPTFGAMQPGDGVTFDSPFNVNNQGDFTIVSVETDSISFVNDIGSDETVIGQVNVYSSGPVQKGDVLDITDPSFAYPNRGQFVITRITDQFVEFSNPDAVPESVTGVTSGIVIYPEAYIWMLLGVDNKVTVKLNGDTGTGTEVEPPVYYDLAENPGLLLKRGKVFRIDVTNPTLSVAQGFIFLAV